jgi:hypothetical protein
MIGIISLVIDYNLAVVSVIASKAVGLYMSYSLNQLPLPSSYEETIPYHLIEIRNSLDGIQGLISTCSLLLASIFCALMDVGDQLRGRGHV